MSIAASLNFHSWIILIFYDRLKDILSSFLYQRNENNLYTHKSAKFFMFYKIVVMRQIRKSNYDCKQLQHLFSSVLKKNKTSG